MAQIREMAGEASDVLTFTGGLSEALDEAEQEEQGTTQDESQQPAFNFGTPMNVTVFFRSEAGV
jgi:hypothetical protein